MPDIKITILKTLDPKEMFGEEFPFKEPADRCSQDRFLRPFSA